MRIPPDSVLETWPIPNHINPASRGIAGNVVGVTLISSVSVLLILRIYTRTYISHGWGLDDVLIILAFFPATAFEIIGIIGDTHLHWDRHIWDIEPDAFVPSLKFAFANFLLFDCATTLTKLSMLAIIYRLTAVTTDRFMTRIVTFLSVLISTNGILFMFITIFQCRPVSAYWTLSAEPQSCIDEGVHLLSAGIINTITDFVLVFLPIKTVMNLQLPRRQQMIVIALFGAGFLAGIAGIIRTYFTWYMTDAPDWDKQWNAWAAWIASGVELYIGITCASIPSIKPIFAKFLPIVLESNILSRNRRLSIFTHNSRRKKSAQVTNINYTNKTLVDNPDSPMQLLPPDTPYTPSCYSAGLDLESGDAGDNMTKTRSIIWTTSERTSQRPSRFSEDPSVRRARISSHSPSNRGGVRFSNRSSMPFATDGRAVEDRTTVLIMLKDDTLSITDEEERPTSPEGNMPTTPMSAKL